MKRFFNNADETSSVINLDIMGSTCLTRYSQCLEANNYNEPTTATLRSELYQGTNCQSLRKREKVLRATTLAVNFKKKKTKFGNFGLKYKFQTLLFVA